MPVASSHSNRHGALRKMALLCVCILASVIGICNSASQAQESAVLRLAGPETGPDTLDPLRTRDVLGVEIIRQLFRGLMYFDDELNPVPELAERYTVSDNGLSYRFILRDGISFHNGRQIVAADVVYSLSRGVEPDIEGSNPELLVAPSFLLDIEGYAEVASGKSDTLRGIVALSDREVEIRLTRPRATFLMMLTSYPAAIVDREQIEADDLWYLHPNGSGPFVVDSWEQDDELVLHAFENYSPGEPMVQIVEYRLGQRAARSFNLYQIDEIDIDHVSLYDLDRAIDPNGEYAEELVRTPQFSFGYIALRTDVAPLDDPFIRLALQRVFPRRTMAEVVFNGQLNPANGLIPRGMLGVDWAALPRDNDLKAAREAIASSRYELPERVPAIRIYSAGALASDVLREIAETELGLTVEVFEMEWSSFLDRLADNTFPAYELSWVADYPDPEGILGPLWGSGQLDNSTGYSNAEVDALLTNAANELEPGARVSIYQAVQELILADNVVIPTFFDVEYTVRKPWVTGLTVTQIGILRLETIRIDG